MSGEKNPCSGCKYTFGAGYCDYLGQTGQRRPCPPGEGCTVRIKAGKSAAAHHIEQWKQFAIKDKAIKDKKVRNMQARKWDVELALSMYNEGTSDQKIAEACGVKIGTIKRWRGTAGLPTKQKTGRQHKQKGDTPKEKHEEEAEMNQDPVEETVEMDELDTMDELDESDESKEAAGTDQSKELESDEEESCDMLFLRLLSYIDKKLEEINPNKTLGCGSVADVLVTAGKVRALKDLKDELILISMIQGVTEIH